MSYPPVRSYVRREGRITKAQSRALVELWPEYGIENAEGVLNFKQIYGRTVPNIMEIGFGDGRALVSMAADNPQCNFLGIDVYRPGVGSLLLQLKKFGLVNVRVMMDDAVTVIDKSIGKECLSKLLIFFPDPWPKKRHHKRRLVQRDFLAIAAERLSIGGYIHIATDWEEYAASMLALLQGESRLRNMSAADGFVERPAYRPQTKYERRGEGQGHRVWDVVFKRVA